MSEEKIKKKLKNLIFFLVGPDFLTSEGSLTKEYTECRLTSVISVTSIMSVVAVSCGYDTQFAVRLVMDYTQKSTTPILALKLSVSAIITPRWTATLVSILECYRGHKKRYNQSEIKSEAVYSILVSNNLVAHFANQLAERYMKKQMKDLELYVHGLNRQPLHVER